MNFLKKQKEQFPKIKPSPIMGQLHDAVTFDGKGLWQESEWKNFECTNHGPLLFINDLSSQHKYAGEELAVYRCACLTCGLRTDYTISPGMRRMIINTQKENGLERQMDFYSLQEEIAEFRKMNPDPKALEIYIEQVNQRYLTQEVNSKRARKL